MPAQKKESKVIFMGNRDVGKTSIIKSYIENRSMRGQILDRTGVMEDFTKLVNVNDS